MACRGTHLAVWAVPDLFRTREHGAFMDYPYSDNLLYSLMNRMWGKVFVFLVALDTTDCCAGYAIHADLRKRQGLYVCEWWFGG